MGAIEAIAALRDQHDFFFKLADDRQYHSKNDIGTASSLYETIKYTYKKALVPLTEHGRPDSNFISKKAHELLSKL